MRARAPASGGKTSRKPAVARKGAAAGRAAASKGASSKGAARAAGAAAKPTKASRAETARLRLMAQGRAANAEHRQAAAQTMGRLLREVCGIVALFAALIALLSLGTFDQGDPGWSHTGNGSNVHNSVGRAGAWFADVAFYLVGVMAYLIPVLLAFSGWTLFRSARKRVPGYRPFMFIQLIGVAMMFVAASGLADLHVGVPAGALPEGTFGGGILGTVTAWRLVGFLHPLGTTLLLLGLFFCSLTLAFGTSWIQLIELLGSFMMRAVDWVRDQYSSTADARRERELRRRELYGDELDLPFSVARGDDVGVDFDAELTARSRRGKQAAASPSEEVSGKAPATGRARKAAKAVSPLRQAKGQASDKSAAQGNEDSGTGTEGVGAINGRAGRRWIGSRKDSDEADPLLDALPEDLPGNLSGQVPGHLPGELPEVKPKVGLAAALELARNSARRNGSSADGSIPLGAGAEHDAAAEVSAKSGSSSEKFDAMADALDESMTLDPDAAVSREPGSRAVLKAARALKIAERADRTGPVSSDFDPLAAATAMSVPAAAPAAAPPAIDPGASRATSDNDTAPAKPAAGKGKPRSSEQVQAKLYLDVPDSDLPPLSLLDAPEPQRAGFTRDELEALSRLLEEKLAEFRIEVEVVAVHPGPVITSFEMQPAPGIKASRITGLAQDIARSMSLPSVRVVEVIPGKSTIGIEVPNDHREIVQLSEMLQSEAYGRQKSPLTLALGKDIAGNAVTADLARMPHLLVAGTTGSGKSVAVNAMLISLLYKATAKDVRLILIDPKMLELNVYDDIPHLLSPVVTDMSEAANALRWCVGEMERRYTLMAALKVRNLAGYNKKIADAETSGIPVTDPTWQAELSLDPTGPPPVLEPMPMIVVVVDEFADMMMQVGKKAEELITRIAQKARAAGIHLILATQRPSVDVITGLIKANVPSRIAFQVSQKVDSRTIIDQGGAESLLGHGDMLYLPPGTGVPIRVHGAFVDDHEVHSVVSHIKQTGEPNYIEEILHESTAAIPGISGGTEETEAETDVLYDQAVAVVLESRKASISYVQRRLKIGYNRAARMIEDMENAGVVSTVTGNGTREVLAPPPGG